MTSGRCETEQLYVHIHFCIGHQHVEKSKFSKILTLVKGLTITIDEISSLRRISLLRGAAFRFQVSRRVVAPWRNCISRGNCSHDNACTVWAVSMLGAGFRHGKGWISEKFSGHVVSTCLNFIF